MVDTLYQNGKAYLQNVWDAAGNFISQTQWTAGSEVVTSVRNGQVYLIQTWDAAGNCTEQAWCREAVMPNRNGTPRASSS